MYVCVGGHTEGSSDIILTVLSARPTARNRDRCSPGATVPRLMHTTSADISLRSVYSLSCPDWRRRRWRREQRRRAKERGDERERRVQRRGEEKTIIGKDKK